jgi:hypothetical protein
MSLAFDQQAHAEPTTVAAPHQQRLPSGLREELGAQFDADFDDVAIAPTAAAPALTAHGADAVTVGDAIAFGDTAYQPESGWGRELIAHELAHVVQQRGGTGGPPVADPAAFEQQADNAARAAVAGQQVPALSAAPVTGQARVSLRDVGRGEQSGFARVPELVERLNRVSLGLTFTLRQEGRFQILEYTRILPLDLCSEFDRRMIGFIDDVADIPLRLTNRHGLLGSFNVNPDGTRTFVSEGGVFEDAWQSGYVDIDDLLASSDLGIQDVLVHFMTERLVTRNYARRMGIPGGQPGGLDTRPGFDQEFQAAHRRGLQAELALLRDFFGDPGIRAVDLQARRFRSTRGDIIRVRITEGRTAATRGTQGVSFEVVLHDTGAVITAEDYLALLERERAAAAAAAAAAAGAAAGAGVP